MNLIHKIENFQKLHTLIEQEKTGTPQELAATLYISKTKLYELFGELRSFGKQIAYNRKLKTFYYKDEMKLAIHFSIRTIQQEELKTIEGGTNFPFPFFFLNGAPLYLLRFN